MREYTGSPKYRKRGISWHITCLLVWSCSNIFGYVFTYFLHCCERIKQHSQISRNLVNFQEFSSSRSSKCLWKDISKFQYFSRSSSTYTNHVYKYRWCCYLQWLQGYNALASSLYFYTRFLIRKKFIRNEAQMVKVFRKSQENHEAQFPKFSVFIGQKSIFRHYCTQNV